MANPPSGSARPKLFNSIAELSLKLDQASIPAAPAVQVLDLPDVPAPRKADAPWWVEADVELVPAKKTGPAPVVVVARPHRAPGINWKLIRASAVAASVMMGIMVFTAWALTGKSSSAVAGIPAGDPLLVVSNKLPRMPDPVPEALPVPQPEPAPPTVEERIAEIERQYRTAVARFQESILAEREQERATQQQALRQAALATEPKGCFGTAIDFAASPAEANDLALKTKKLVMVLTISGNFEESKFT
jgi:hypothetical protein